MEWQTLGRKLADACASSSAALAHSLRCGGGACAQSNCTAPSSLSPCVLYVVCECIALTAHGHGPISNGVADTGVEAS